MRWRFNYRRLVAPPPLFKSVCFVYGRADERRYAPTAFPGNHDTGHRESQPACNSQASSESGCGFFPNWFDVTRCNQNYRLSDSSLLIRFSESTSFDEVTETATLIPLDSFRFRNHREMIGLANTNTQLPGEAIFGVEQQHMIW